MYTQSNTHRTLDAPQSQLHKSTVTSFNMFCPVRNFGLVRTEVCILAFQAADAEMFLNSSIEKNKWQETGAVTDSFHDNLRYPFTNQSHPRWQAVFPKKM
jgi:hypothetical protein